jgi:hypothetical protein
LREREDEDEVEEELERGDAMLALGVLLTHSATLARSEPRPPALQWGWQRFEDRGVRDRLEKQPRARAGQDERRTE